MLDDYVRTEGRPEVVQFSGGEPTMHPQIIDFVRAAYARNIRFVMINTNGKRIARDDRFLELVEHARLHVLHPRPRPAAMADEVGGEGLGHASVDRGGQGSRKRGR